MTDAGERLVAAAKEALEKAKNDKKEPCPQCGEMIFKSARSTHLFMCKGAHE